MWNDVAMLDPAVLDPARVFNRGLGDLSRAEALALLRTSEMGRVGFSTPDGVRIVPVNFVVHGGSDPGTEVLEFRTTAASELAIHAPGTQVAFEVDHVAPDNSRGWSVVVLGECQRDLERFGVSRPGELQASPWAAGRRPMVLLLPARRVTGKVVGWEGPGARHR